MTPQSKIPEVPSDLLGRYDKPGPRYTSYPTAPTWSAEHGSAEHADRLGPQGSTPVDRCRCTCTCRTARACAGSVAATS